jgi:hypothetical protein
MPKRDELELLVTGIQDQYGGHVVHLPLVESGRRFRPRNSSGVGRIRTDGILVASEALYQLSYDPEHNAVVQACSSTGMQ